MLWPDSRSAHRVTDPRQAAFLADPTRKPYFAPFLARDQTVTAAAGEAGCAPNSMLYRVRTMTALGLLRVVGTRPRAGRAVKVYRSTHDAYFVPFEATPYATLQERVEVQSQPLFAALSRAYAAVLADHAHGGNLIARGENGVVWTTDLPPRLTDQGQPLVFCDGTVQLTRGEAQDVGDTLMATFERAIRADGGPEGEGEPYLMVVALVPLKRP